MKLNCEWKETGKKTRVSGPCARLRCQNLPNISVERNLEKSWPQKTRGGSWWAFNWAPLYTSHILWWGNRNDFSERNSPRPFLFFWWSFNLSIFHFFKLTWWQNLNKEIFWVFTSCDFEIVPVVIDCKRLILWFANPGGQKKKTVEYCQTIKGWMFKKRDWRCWPKLLQQEPDLRFVKKFTRPDFRAKKFTH